MHNTEKTRVVENAQATEKPPWYFSFKTKTLKIDLNIAQACKAEVKKRQQKSRFFNQKQRATYSYIYTCKMYFKCWARMLKDAPQ